MAQIFLRRVFFDEDDSDDEYFGLNDTSDDDPAEYDPNSDCWIQNSDEEDESEGSDNGIGLRDEGDLDTPGSSARSPIPADNPKHHRTQPYLSNESRSGIT